MLAEIAVIKVPSVLEQQAGATEELVVPFKSVVANDDASAILRFAVENVDEIKEKLEKNELAKAKVVVRRTGV